MAPKSSASLGLILGLNLVFFSLVSAYSYYPDQPTTMPSSYNNPTPVPSSYKSGPTAKPYPTTPYPKGPYYPKDTLKFGVCANILKALYLHVGVLPTDPYCCPLIQGLTDLEAAICLCTAIKANILGIRVNAKVEIELLLNYCGYGYPRGYKCAY